MRARVVVTTTAVLLAGAASAHAAPADIGPGHVDGVRVGATYASLKAKGLVGRLRAGCPLGGPGARVARLRAPLQGTVELTRGSTRRVSTILVSGGSTARGVGVGAKLSAVRSAYPRTKVEKSTADVFGIWLASVPKGAGGELQFGIDAKTREVTQIGVPGLAFCD